jgi:hypothetical protein
MRSWYADSLFILHYDRHFSPAETPPAVSGFDPDQVRRVLGRVRPDAVQYCAKGHQGYVPYPTRHGNQVPALSEEPRQDILGLYRDITRELEIRLVLGYSGLIDYLAVNWRPGWQRVRADYTPYPSRAICPNSGYVEELMLPQLDEILQEYRPDGIWVDADAWTVAPCYCTACESEFQMLHERSAPQQRGDHLWEEWIQLHRDSFQRYLTRVARYLHERDPALVYASAGAFCTHQAEDVPMGPDRLSWDLSPAFSLRQAGMEARFLDSHGAPFDLMTWNRCSARPWPQGKLPALPVYPKTFDHLAQEGALILANGGRWTVSMTPYPDDALPEAEHALVALAASFARERAPWCAGAESAAVIAVLHSDATHRKAGNGLYDPGPSLDRIRGAHQALQELHLPHDIVNEADLQRRLHRYRLVVLPEQVALPLGLDDVLLDWARHGGVLVATGRVSPRLNEDIPTFALEEALGVQWTGRSRPEGWAFVEGSPMRIPAPVHHVTPTGAEIVLPLLSSGHEHRLDPPDHPLITRHKLNGGVAVYAAADLFAAYHRSQYPGIRSLIGQMLERALQPAPLLTTASPAIEMALRRREGDLILHLVNHSPGKSLAQNSPFVETVPPSEPFSVTLPLESRPASVRLQPGDTEPEWSHTEGTLTVFLPPFQIHAAVVIRERGGV